MVEEVINQYYPQSTNKITWNGLNESGEQLAAGVYIYQLTTKEQTSSGPLFIME